MDCIFLLAEATPGGGRGGAGFDPMGILIWIVPLILVFYFILIRPQKKREEERKDMLSKLTKGAEVVTLGGICGEIVRLGEREVVLRVDNKKGVEIKMLRSAISGVVGGTATSAGESMEKTD